MRWEGGVFLDYNLSTEEMDMAYMHFYLHACLSNMLISIVLHGVIVGILRVRVTRDQEGDGILHSPSQ